MKNDKTLLLMMFLLLGGVAGSNAPHAHVLGRCSGGCCCWGGVAEAPMPLMLLLLAFDASNKKRPRHDHDVPAVGRRS